jgi:hypothetical protein
MSLQSQELKVDNQLEIKIIRKHRKNGTSMSQIVIDTIQEYKCDEKANGKNECNV